MGRKAKLAVMIATVPPIRGINVQQGRKLSDPRNDPFQKNHRTVTVPPILGINVQQGRK